MINFLVSELRINDRTPSIPCFVGPSPRQRNGPGCANATYVHNCIGKLGSENSICTAVKDICFIESLRL